MVAKADAGRQPGTVVIHLEDAAAAGRAVVGAIGFSGLAFLAEAHLAVGFDGEGCGGGRRVGWEGAVAVVVCRAAGGREDCGCVAPVEQEVEDEAEESDVGGCENYTERLGTKRKSDVGGSRGGQGSVRTQPGNPRRDRTQSPEDIASP